eukprot:3213109-Rhodomonas_salina.1
MADSTGAPDEERRHIALFACLKFLFNNNIGQSQTRKRKRARDDLEFHEQTLAAAHFLYLTGYSSGCEGESCSDDDLDEAYMTTAFKAKRTVQVKPRGKDPIISRWITDPFWFEDPEFKRNLSVSHTTFLHVVDLVKGTVHDSVNRRSGHVYATKEFKVAVALYYLGHGGTWSNLSNVASIGLSTAKSYAKIVCGAIISHCKQLYMPGVPCADSLARVMSADRFS